MGNKFVIGDPARCIGCGTCLAACMMEHEPFDGVPIPRLNLIKTYRVSTPVGCHHCQDASCVAACPQKVLCNEDGKVYAKDKGCIGCYSCVIACPYGAIDIISVESPVTYNGITYKIGTRSQPLKCDLCVSRGELGPACVSHCLTKSLQYLDEDSIAQLVLDRQKAAATALA